MAFEKQSPSPANHGPQAIQEDLLSFAHSLVELASWTISEQERLTKLVGLGIKVYKAGGKICPTGVGKSFLLAERMSARLRSHGLVSVALHPVEALHGDLGLLSPGDLIVFISHSGASLEMLQLADHLKRFPIQSVGFGSKIDDPFHLNLWIPLPPTSECCPLGLAPTTSQLRLHALIDSLINRWVEGLQLQRSDFALMHPSGSLGRRLFREQTRVENVMHKHPMASPETSLKDLTLQMTDQRLGAIVIVEEGALLGLITEADLRRAYLSAEGWDLPARMIMNPHPQTIGPEQTLEEAFLMMEQRQTPISALPVLSKDGKALGLIRLHDCFAAV